MEILRLVLLICTAPLRLARARNEPIKRIVHAAKFKAAALKNFSGEFYKLTILLNFGGKFY